jgi:hypothetical protein
MKTEPAVIRCVGRYIHRPIYSPGYKADMFDNDPGGDYRVEPQIVGIMAFWIDEGLTAHEERFELNDVPDFEVVECTVGIVTVIGWGDFEVALIGAGWRNGAKKEDIQPLRKSELQSPYGKRGIAWYPPESTTD